MTDEVPTHTKGEYINSYWIGFDATGVEAVDAVLYRLCRAAKMFHSTEMWTDTDKYTPVSPNDLIQQAADEAADEIVRLREALGDYGHHDSDCATHRRTIDNQGWSCTCGLDDLLGEQP